MSSAYGSPYPQAGHLPGLCARFISHLIPTAAMPWVLRGSGLVVIVMGLIMIQEYFNPESPIRLGIPASLHRRVHRYAHATNIGTAFAAGAAIGLCSVPCSGAVYLGVVSLLTMFGPILGIVYLLLYNVAFILPVLILLFTVTSRPALLSFTHWYLNFRQTTKLWLGVFVILLGFLVIWLA